MKTILLLRNNLKPFWKDIASYLRAVNAKVILIENSFSMGELSGEKPDLVVSDDEFFKEMPASLQGIPKLVVSEEEAGGGRAKDVFVLKWPFGRESFLEITSRLLYISERRLFRAVINIAHRDGTCLGRSLNFSTSGMAFKADRAFNVGDALTVSFFIPGMDERLSVEVEVMRNSLDPDDGLPYYGARFINPGHAVIEALEGFIRKGR